MREHNGIDGPKEKPLTAKLAKKGSKVRKEIERASSSLIFQFAGR